MVSHALPTGQVETIEHLQSFIFLNIQVDGRRHWLLLLIPNDNKGDSRRKVVETVASTLLRLLADLGQLTCLGGGPAQTLQQACLP